MGDTGFGSFLLRSAFCDRCLCLACTHLDGKVTWCYGCRNSPSSTDFFGKTYAQRLQMLKPLVEVLWQTQWRLQSSKPQRTSTQKAHFPEEPFPNHAWVLPVAGGLVVQRRWQIPKSCPNLYLRQAAVSVMKASTKTSKQLPLHTIRKMPAMQAGCSATVGHRICCSYQHGVLGSDVRFHQILRSNYHPG